MMWFLNSHENIRIKYIWYKIINEYLQKSFVKDPNLHVPVPRTSLCTDYWIKNMTATESNSSGTNLQ